MAEKSISKQPEIVTMPPPDVKNPGIKNPDIKGPDLKDYDLKKVFGEMKLPAMPDIDVVLATHRRNLEALSEANRVALEGAQAVARRHMEIMQSTMAGLTETLKDLSASDGPATRASKQTDLLKQAYENAVSNTRELGDLIQKSNTEAMQKLNQRFSEAMSEMKDVFHKKK
jgi:phasin family protein